MAHQNGFLVISDITGYTAFLTGSEVEHAEDILDSIFDVLLSHTQPPLVVSKLEGDAILSYAAADSVIQGQTLVEMVEQMYAAFRKLKDRMHLNTTCTCQACSNIPNLDLKFFLHYGSFSLRDIGGRQELSGPDVILIHRLLKNQVSEKTGLGAYALYTQAAVDALGIAEMCAEMTPHQETYEHLGEIPLHIQAMHEVWEEHRHEHRVKVTPAEEVATIEYDFPYPPEVVWDYLTKPEYRAIYFGSDSQYVSEQSNGRTTKGSVFHCVHGKAVVKHIIVDWEPFDFYTFETPHGVPGTSLLCMDKLTRTANGTRLTHVLGKTSANPVVAFVCDILSRIMIKSWIAKGLARLHEQIEQDIAEGKHSHATAVTVPKEEIAAAIRESVPSEG